ncbi:unnamed protein product [Calicophoron daubneyi]
MHRRNFRYNFESLSCRLNCGLFKCRHGIGLNQDIPYSYLAWVSSKSGTQPYASLSVYKNNDVCERDTVLSKIPYHFAAASTNLWSESGASVQRIGEKHVRRRVRRGMCVPTHSRCMPCELP